MDPELPHNVESHLMPVIRVAPLDELRVYVISEDELNELEQGSPASLHLNFALALLASGILTTEIRSAKSFTVFVVVTVVFLVAGTVLFANWYKLRGSSKGLAQRIRDRMPPTGIPDA